jgi:hypothetical protein
MRHCGVMRMGVSPLAAFGADWPSGGRRQGGGFCRSSCASSLETYHDMNVRGTDGSKFRMIAEAERRFPVRVRIAVPPEAVSANGSMRCRVGLTRTRGRTVGL